MYQVAREIPDCFKGTFPRIKITISRGTDARLSLFRGHEAPKTRRELNVRIRREFLNTSGIHLPFVSIQPGRVWLAMLYEPIAIVVQRDGYLW